MLQVPMSTHLALYDFPGPKVEPGGISRLYAALDALTPPGQRLEMDIAHDHPCPCATYRKGWHACTCERVDIRLRRSERAAVVTN